MKTLNLTFSILLLIVCIILDVLAVIQLEGSTLGAILFITLLGYIGSWLYYDNYKSLK